MSTIDTLWSWLKTLSPFVVVALALIYAIKSRDIIRFVFRSYLRSANPDFGGRLTALLATIWYLKYLFLPQGLRHWLLGELAQGVPSDLKPLQYQDQNAEQAARFLLLDGTRIVIFTGNSGWGKTYTSHALKARLAPLTQLDLSWTMIAPDPESTIVAALLPTTLPPGPSPSSSPRYSFENLETRRLAARSTTSPHFFVHIHDFEAIEIDSHSLAAARTLLDRVADQPQLSLIITTRHSETHFRQLLTLPEHNTDYSRPTPRPAAPLCRFITVPSHSEPGFRLSKADVGRLLHRPDTEVTSNDTTLSPLQLTLRAEYFRHAGNAPTNPLDLYLQLFRFLPASDQVALQLLLARLIVSPQKLFARASEIDLPSLVSPSTLFACFAYPVGDHIRLAHPTVLELYAQSDFMSPASAATRHEHWSHAFATQNSRDSIEILQRIRHELRAHQLQSDIEDRLTTASEELNLSLCRFVFECRADYHHFALRSPNHDTPPSFLHDVDREQYQYVGTIADQTTPATPAAALHNIAKMMELLYQGLDEWEPANRLADRLEKTLRQPWMTYGSSMKAICEFDLAKHPRSSETAITLSEPARRAFPARYSGSMTRATMLINEGIFRNNTFRRSDSFETAGALYTEAGALIDTALRREAHARFRRLLVREKLRVLSGLLRWEYLRAGFSARPDLVKSYWSAGCAAVEGESGRPVEKGMQEFAYLALNASFIELARTGIRGDVATYYREARNHQEAAGDRWFRRRLDQMKIAIDMLLPTSHQSLRQQLKELGRINDELARDDDWTGVAFCTYQIVRAERYTSPNDEGIEKEVERRYEVLRDAPGSSPTHFSKRPCFSTRLEREHFFEILLYGKEQGKYFPAWPSRQMPLNLQGLLMLRSISLLDQANWRRGGWWS